MSPSQVALKLVLEAIDQPLDLATFEHRFMLQKKVYLTQIAGLSGAPPW